MNWKFLDKLAEELGITPWTRQKWRTRKSVPHHARLPMMELAAKYGVPLKAEDFEEQRQAK